MDWNLAHCEDCYFREAKMNNTCKDCKDRHINCHATCEAYITAKKEHEQNKEQIFKSKYEAYSTYTLPKARVRKRRKKL